MVLKKFRNKKGGRSFSEGWNQGTNDIKSGADKANEKRKEMMLGINKGLTDFKSGFNNQHHANKLKAMSPTLSIGGRRRRRRRSRTRRKTKRRRSSRRRKTRRKRKSRRKRRR